MNKNLHSLVLFTSTVVVIFAMMIFIVVYARRIDADHQPRYTLPQSQTQTVRQKAAQTQPALAPAQPVASSQAVATSQSTDATALVARRIDGPLPLDQPHGTAWDQAAPMTVPMFPQLMAMPTQDKQSVAVIEARALTDGKHLAVRLSWEDASVDATVDSGRFTDAVAIMFPLDPGAAFTMGAANMKVNILQWKAVWQKDIDERFQDVQDVHPNYWFDLYWFAEPTSKTQDGRVTYRVPESFKNPVSKQWFTAYSAGNPITQFERRTPVQELVAEGFGTLTAQSEAVADGRGVWKDGRWAVVFVRPLKTDDPLDVQLSPGAQTQYSLAVWDGAHSDVGGRKQWSNWAPLKVQP
jgi:hypothetical protein